MLKQCMKCGTLIPDAEPLYWSGPGGPFCSIECMTGWERDAARAEGFNRGFEAAIASMNEPRPLDVFLPRPRGAVLLQRLRRLFRKHREEMRASLLMMK